MLAFQRNISLRVARASGTGFFRILGTLSVMGSLVMFAFGVAGSGSAQALPPNRYYGTVTINGTQQSDGTVVEAYVGDTLCGSGTVSNQNGNEFYLVDVLGGGQKAGCASDGDTVSFRVNGLKANETGAYATGAATRLDLTASGSATQVPLPTVLPPNGGGTPAPPPTPPPFETVIATSAPPSPVATPESSPEASETPGPTPSTTPTPTATVELSSTPIATPTVLAPLPRSTTGNDGSRRTGAIVVAVLVILIAGGAAAWLLRRRMVA